MDFSLQEFFIIFFVFCILFKKEDLPRYCYYMGRFITKLNILKIKLLDFFTNYSIEFEESLNKDKKI